VWTGERLVVWQGTRGLGYDPARGVWERLEPEVRLRASWSPVPVVIDPGRVAVLGARPADTPRATGIVCDLEDDAVEAIPPGGPPPVLPPQLVAAGEQLLALPGPATALDQPRVPVPMVWDRPVGVWRRLPPALGGRLSACTVWTGDELLVWGGSDGEANRADGMRWRPPAP
jgi:hypothetical protein